MIRIKSILQEAKEKLDALTPNIKAIVGDEIKMLMANEEAAIGVVWSGDAADIMWENENLDYVFQKKARIYGLIIWSFQKQPKMWKVHINSLISCLTRKMLHKTQNMSAIPPQIKTALKLFARRNGE